MKFYSGFYLQNEQYLFAHLMQESDFYIYGFSYGAIKAFEEVKMRLGAFERVDKLVLFSPAFFQTKTEAFKKLQLRSFKKAPKMYVKNFLGSCFAPYRQENVQTKEDSIEDLERLLYYEWSSDELLWLKEQGVSVEVYLGGEDHIIDVDGAYDFFKDIAHVTLFKEANHFLQKKE